MIDIFKLEFQTKLSKEMSIKTSAAGDIFNSLHFFLINSSWNIAFHYKESPGQRTRFYFLAESESQLLFLEKFLKNELSHKEMEERFKVTVPKETFLKITARTIRKLAPLIESIGVGRAAYKNSEAILFKRSRPRAHHLSRSKLKQTIRYTLENMHKDFKGVKADLKIILKYINNKDIEILLSDSKESDQLFTEIRNRLKKRHNGKTISHIYTSSNTIKNTTFYFSEPPISIENPKDFTWTVNRYGLSTEDKTFPIPIPA